MVVVDISIDIKSIFMIVIRFWSVSLTPQWNDEIIRVVVVVVVEVVVSGITMSPPDILSLLCCPAQS